MKAGLLFLVTISMLFLLVSGAESTAMENSSDQNDTLVLTTISKDLYICTCKPDIANPGGGGEIYFQGKYYDDVVTEDADYHNCDERFLMQWDLTEVPEGIKIIEAKMLLVCAGYTGDKEGQLVYECVSEPWEENAGYNEKPGTLPETRIMTDWPQKSTYHIVDITDFVKSWYKGSIPNYGLMGFSINTETTNSALFCSSKFHQEDARPKLTIIFSKQ
mgnify:CR=1 FL=1